MKKTLLYLFASFLFLTSCSEQDEDDNLRVETQRITNAPHRHQAFTDLVFFDNQFFLTFRESDKHAYGENGTVKLMNSKDGANWALIKEFSVSGIDLRDPKFAVNGNELMLYLHGFTFKEGIISVFHDYRLKYSNEWNQIENVTLDNKQHTTRKSTGNEAWPWRVTWHNGNAYSIGYNGVDIFGMYKSTDGVFFQNDKILNSVTNLPTEATIRINEKGEMYVLARRNNGLALLGKYEDVSREFREVGELPFFNFRGPNFLFLNDKQILFSGGEKTALLGLYDLETNRTKVIFKFGSGDCSYPGMVIKDDILWLSYFSTSGGIHESSIYILKIELENLRREYIN